QPPAAPAYAPDPQLYQEALAPQQQVHPQPQPQPSLRATAHAQQGPRYLAPGESVAGWMQQDGKGARHQ
nr:hypothetical protein [Succinivibrionaceae bacterium]